MTTRMIGCAELYGRLRHVTNQTGLQRRTGSPVGEPSSSAFEDDQAALDLHRHVLLTFGVSAEYLHSVDGRSVGDVYAAYGFALTEKATQLARLSHEFEESCTWGEATSLAASRAHRLDDFPADQTIGALSLLAVARHVAREFPAAMATRTASGTPLFLNGYPTTLLGHVAAELHVDAVTATCTREADVVKLFRELGWQLSPRAEALAETLQHHESMGKSWSDVIAAVVPAAEHGRRDR